MASLKHKLEIDDVEMKQESLMVVWKKPLVPKDARTLGAEMYWNKMAEDDPRLWDSPVAWEEALANGEKTKENHPIVDTWGWCRIFN